MGYKQSRSQNLNHGRSPSGIFPRSFNRGTMAARGKKSQPTKNNKRRPTLKRRRQLPEPARFPVVGIGASAGGLEAFKQLLENLPANTGMAFVLIQHLD